MENKVTKIQKSIFGWKFNDLKKQFVNKKTFVLRHFNGCIISSFFNIVEFNDDDCIIQSGNVILKIIK